MQKVTTQISKLFLKATTHAQPCKALVKYITLTLKILLELPEESQETPLKNRSLGPSKKRNNKCKLKKFNETQRATKSQNRKIRKLSHKPKMLILRNHSRLRSLKRRKLPRFQLMTATMLWKTKSLNLIPMHRLFNLCKLKTVKPHGSNLIKRLQTSSEFSAPRRETRSLTTTPTSTTGRSFRYPQSKTSRTSWLPI